MPWIMILHCKLGLSASNCFRVKKEKQFISMRIYATKIKHDALRHRPLSETATASAKCESNASGVGDAVCFYPPRGVGFP